MSTNPNPTVVITEAVFSTNFKLYAPDGTQLQFTCRAGATHAEHLAALEAYRQSVLAGGYATELPGLDENEKIEEVAAYVRGATKAGQPLIWLYSSKEVLKWRLATVYAERLAELPFPIASQVWPGTAAPEREEAQNKGYLQPIQPLKIVLEGSETDENGKRRWKFARLYGNGNGNGNGRGRGHAPTNGNGHGPAPAAEAAAAPAAHGNGAAQAAATNGTPACPKCGGAMWDNRTSKKNPRAPDFKCKRPDCDGAIWPAKTPSAASPQATSGVPF